MGSKDRFARFSELRERVEEELRRQPEERSAPADKKDEKLIHELELHQLELELHSEELRSAEAALVECRENYRAFFELAPVGCFTLDSSGRILDANTAARRFFGVPRDELLGRSLTSFLSKSEGGKLQRHVQDVLKQGGHLACELTFDLLSSGAGHTVQARLESTTLKSTTKRHRQVQSVLFDVTDLRRTERERQSANAQGSAILDTVTDSVITSDASDAIESFNDAAERLFGYKAEEVLGRNIRLLLPNLDRNSCSQTIQRYSASGEPRVRIAAGANGQVFGRRKDGTTFPLEMNLGQWWDSGRRKFTTALRDTTELGLVEARILQHERYVRQIADQLECILAVVDRTSRRVLYANRAFERIWGRPVSELKNIGTTWWSWVHPEDRSRVESAYEMFAKEGHFDEAFRIQRPDEKLRWLRMKAFPIQDEDTLTQHDVVLMQDITGDIDREEELRQAQKMEALGALTVGVAHDFGNVLQAALGCVNMAREGGTSRRSTEEYLDRARNAIRQGAELTAQLMAFVRKRSAEPKTLELDGIVRSVSKLLEHLVTEQVAIQISTQAPGAKIFADPIQIEQILMNLAANARDAMPQGGTLSIETQNLDSGDSQAIHHGCSTDRAYVCLVVRDSGKGMDQKTQEQIFKPFFTANSTNRGTGLGLATVLGVTRRMDGHIHVDSTPNLGTTFTLYFPLQEEAPAPASSERRRIPHFNGTALLVENEPEVRITVQHYLESLGLHVLEAEDAVAAQVLFEQHASAIDILISDLVLPAFPGTRLALLLRRRNPDLPVLLMSANQEGLERSRDSVENAQRLLKPFDREQLSDHLQELLQPDFSSSHESATQRRVECGRSLIAESPRQKKTILLVEDEQNVREALEAVLLQEGYRVLSAARPSDALRLAETGEPTDVLLTDFRPPEMQGDELARKMCGIFPDLEVIFMSGLFAPPNSTAAFIQKPIDLSKLLEIIRHRLSARGQHSA